jgi:hypothetical protein
VATRKTSDTWLRRLDSLITNHESKLASRIKELERVEGRFRAELNSVTRLKSQLDGEMRNFSSALEQLIQARRDPVVYVRNYGSHRNVYHATLDCGWAPYAYERLLWSDAQDRELRPCSACGHAADQEARRIKEQEDARKAA